MVELFVTRTQGDASDSEGLYEAFDIRTDGVTVGAASVRSWADGTALVDRIDIDEAHRGHGYGTEALQTLAGRYDDGIYLAADNPRAAALYSRLGDDVRYRDPWSHFDQGYGVYHID